MLPATIHYPVVQVCVVCWEWHSSVHCIAEPQRATSWMQRYVIQHLNMYSHCILNF